MTLTALGKIKSFLVLFLKIKLWLYNFCSDFLEILYLSSLTAWNFLVNPMINLKCLPQQTGDENIQTYQVEAAILI